MSTVNLTLTPEQQKQVKDATGKDLRELNLSFAAHGELGESELGQVHGGSFSFGASNPADVAYITSHSTGGRSVGKA